jgi:hypothetical protein
LYIRRRFPCCGKLPCLPEESVRRGIFKGRTMFNFRPYVPGFNVEPPAEEEVPGFRMNADGSIRETRAPAAQSYPDDGGNPFDIHYRRGRGGELFTPVGDGTPPPYLAFARRLYDGLGGGPTLGFDVAQPSGMTPLAIPSSSLSPTSSPSYSGSGAVPFSAPPPSSFPNEPASGDELSTSGQYLPLSFAGPGPRRVISTPDADLTNAPILGTSPAAGEPRLESSGTTDPNIVPVGNSDDSQVEVAQAQDQRSGQQTPRPGRNYGLVPQTVIERGMTPLQKKINRDQAFRELTRQPLTAEEARRALPDDWETTKPADIVSEIKRTAERHGVPIQLLARLLYQEGKFNEVDKLGKELRMDSTSKDIPIGYAQMTKNTLENMKNRAAYRGDTKRSEELSTYSLANREQSFDAAAEQLAYLYRLMGGSWPKAVAAYNVGPSLVRWFNGAEIDPQYFTNKADRNGKPLSTDKWTKEVPAYLRFVLRGAAEDPATADMYEPQPPAHYRARDRIDPR